MPRTNEGLQWQNKASLLEAARGGTSAAWTLATSEALCRGGSLDLSMAQQSAGMQHQWCRHATMGSQPHAPKTNKCSTKAHTVKNSHTYFSQSPHDRTK